MGVSVHTSTIFQSLHKDNLYAQVVRKKPLLKRNNLKSYMKFVTKHVAKGFLIRWNKNWASWSRLKELHLVEVQNTISPGQYHPNCQAWWCQHQVMRMHHINRDWEACQDCEDDEWCKVQVNPRGKPV